MLSHPNVAQLIAYEVSAADPVGFLVNYGVAGIVIILLVTGQLRTKAEVSGLQKALEEAVEREKQKDLALANLVQQITQHVLPGLNNLAGVVEALPASTASESDSKRQIAELRRRLAEIEQARS